MSRNASTEFGRSSADSVREKLRDPRYGKEYARGLLISGFLKSAIDNLWHMRRKAGVTQEHIAHELHTKQPAVARLERDTSGKVSLRRYAEFALACDKVPLLMLAPVDDVVEYIIADPTAPRTADAFMAWQWARLEKSSDSMPNLTTQTTTTLVPTGNTAVPGLTLDDGKRAVDEAQRFVNERRHSQLVTTVRSATQTVEPQRQAP